MKDIEENEKQAELKRIWNAIHEIKSLLSKHTADNSQTFLGLIRQTRKRVIILKEGVAMATSAML